MRSWLAARGSNRVGRLTDSGRLQVSTRKDKERHLVASADLGSAEARTRSSDDRVTSAMQQTAYLFVLRWVSREISVAGHFRGIAAKRLPGDTATLRAAIPRDAYHGLLALAICVISAIAAQAQTLIEPERLAEVKRVFDHPAIRPQLRCQVRATQPELNYAFRFISGYTISIPLTQVLGTGRSLTSYLRVTAQGRAPVYLEDRGLLPEIPQMRMKLNRSDAELKGSFVVGEGSYAVDAVVQDEQHRSCSVAWHLDAVRKGAERDLQATTPAGMVEEIEAGPPTTGGVNSGPMAGKLTILVNAAPLSAGSTRMDSSDLDRLLDSLLELMKEIPARSVRVMAFNLDQRTVLFHRERFRPEMRGELEKAMGQLNLGLVDYRTLQKADDPVKLLADLVAAEINSRQPPDALILLGPRTQFHTDYPLALPEKTVPVFALQFLPPPKPLRPVCPGRNEGRYPSTPANPTLRPIQPPDLTDMPDSTQLLVKRLKGEWEPIRAPLDLAEAIRRMDAHIPRTAAPDAEMTSATKSASDPEQMPVTEVSVKPAAENDDVARTANVTEPTGDENPVEVLMKLRGQILERGAHVPNHTCVETIKRDRYQPPGRITGRSCAALLDARKRSAADRLRLDTTDWLRLDVAFISTREVYSWAGANRFENGDIDELIPDGAMGTGSFASILLSLFVQRSPHFTFDGETSRDGRRLFEYAFTVPQQHSSYRFRANKEWIVTGYSGTLLVDPKTAELVHAVLQTEELPPETQTCQSEVTLDYSSVKLGADDFLLPQTARQRFIGRHGGEDENTMTFSGCRQFEAESKVDFEDRTLAGGTSGHQNDRLNLPAGLPVTVELTTAIVLAVAAAGDRVEGRLSKPIVDDQKRTLVPEGTVVHGRMMRVEKAYFPRVEYTVALRWETVDIAGVASPFSLMPNWRQPEAHGSRAGTEIVLPLPTETRYSAIHVAEQHPVLDGGYKSEWLTAKP